MNDYPGTRRLIDTYECGICVDAPADIVSKINLFIEHYERMRQNAFKCYEDNFVFSKLFNRVIDKIEAIESNER